MEVRMAKPKDITGLKFNRLTAIKFMYSKKGCQFWLFKCDCGKEIIARKCAVTSGNHKSCGCLRTEKLKRKKYNEFLIKDDYAIMFVYRKDQIIEVLLDKEDVEKVKALGSWQALYDKTLKVPSYYILHRKSPYTRLHRFIMNCPKNMEVDHINNNPLDNRKINLKVCTHFENQQNLRSKTSEQTGVYYREKRNIWCANITHNKIRYLKEFKTKNEAIKQRKKWESIFYSNKEVMN